jgi:hypothetical protein
MVAPGNAKQAYVLRCSELGCKPNTCLADALDKLGQTLIATVRSPLDGRITPARIDLTGVYLGPKHAIALSKMVAAQYFPLLNTVNFSGNGLSPEAIVALADALRGSSTIEHVSVKGNMLDTISGNVLLQLVKDNYRISALDVSDCSLPESVVESIALQCTLNLHKQRECETARKDLAVILQAQVEVPRCLLDEVWESASNAGDIVLDDDVALDELSLAVADEQDDSSATGPEHQGYSGRSLDLAKAGDDASFYALPKLLSAQQCLSSVSICASSELFSDKEFPPSMSSITGLRPSVAPSCLAQIEWRRLSDLIPVEEIVVDGRGPIEHNSVVRTRYFICAANALRGLEGVRAATCVKAHPDLGLYVFRFIKLGKPVDVVVDDFVPCWNKEALTIPEEQNAGAMLWGRSATPWPVATAHHPGATNDVWITLLEKAYAKLHGSYQAISRGSTQAALQDLTGGVASKLRWTLGDLRYHGRALYDVIRRALVMRSTVLLKPHAVTHMQTRAFDAVGLVANAYYVVEGALPAGPYFAVRLQSPSAFHCWNGRFSKGSPEAEEFRADLKYDSMDMAAAFCSELQQERIQTLKESASVTGSSSSSTGSWDSSSTVVRAMRAAAAAVPGNTTPSFWIAIEELAAFFSSLIILRHSTSDVNSLAVRSVEMRTSISTSALFEKSALFVTNPAFMVVAAKRNTEVVVQASQQDRRLSMSLNSKNGASTAPPYQYPIGLQLTAVRSNNSIVSLRDLIIAEDQIIARSPVAFTREVGLSLTLDGEQGVIVFVSYVGDSAPPGVDVLMRAIGTQRFEMIALPLRHTVTSLEACWDASCASGRLQDMAPKGFLSNPQFLLSPVGKPAVREGGDGVSMKLTIFLEQLGRAEEQSGGDGNANVAFELRSIGFMVVDGDIVSTEKVMVPLAQWTHRRQVVVAGSVEISGPVVLIPSTWNKGEEGRFRIVVLHEQSISIRRKPAALM